MATLPPLQAKLSASAPTLGATRKPTRSLDTRIAELSAQLDRSESAQKSALSELALLASCSASACAAVANAKLETRLARFLANTTNNTLQCWAMSVMSNTADDSESRERQAVAIPTLCTLIGSPQPDVQHAAALHLATLSHSSSLRTAICQQQKVVENLYAIESKESKSLAMPHAKSLRKEAAQYARWALRTPHGRNHKPCFKPKTEEELQLEASVQATGCSRG